MTPPREPGVTRRFDIRFSGESVGYVALQRLRDDVGELPWWEDEPHRRQGRGTVAVREALRWVLGDDGGRRGVVLHAILSSDIVHDPTEVRWGAIRAGLPTKGVVAATRRELDEELGLIPPVSALLVVDCCSSVSPEHDIGCLLFDGGVHDDDLIDAFTYPDGETVRAHWADDSLLDRCGPRLSRRVRAGLAALADGRLPDPPVMLGDGLPEMA